MQEGLQVTPSVISLAFSCFSSPFSVTWHLHFNARVVMKSGIISALALLISGNILFAQNIEESPVNRPRNNIYLSTLGADLTIVSINYERLFFIRPKFFFTGELGIGYNKEMDIGIAYSSSNQFQNAQYLTIPHHITMNVGKRKSFLEFGIGGTGIIGNAKQNYYWYPIIGYRLHPFKSKKANFRVNSSFPIIGWENMEFYVLPLGVSLGIGL